MTVHRSPTLAGALAAALLSGCAASMARPGGAWRGTTDTLPHATVAEVAGLWNTQNAWSWYVPSQAMYCERDPWNPARLANVYVLDGGRCRLCVTLWSEQTGGRFVDDQFLISDPENNRLIRYDARTAYDRHLTLDNKCFAAVRPMGDDAELTLSDFQGHSATLRLSTLRRTRIQHLFEKTMIGKQEFAIAAQGRDNAILFFPIETVVEACDPASDWRRLVPMYVVPSGTQNAAGAWELPPSLPIGDSGFVLTRSGIQVVK